MICELEDKIFKIQSDDFEALALEIFRFQYRGNAIYQAFCKALSVDPTAVARLEHIPFLPVHFFKQFALQTDEWVPEQVFESSGTTQTGNSKHLVKQLSLYRKSFIDTFHLFYGDPARWCILGLLPSYLERGHSSLVLMVDELIAATRNSSSGFYLNNTYALVDRLRSNESVRQPTLLIGVTFALLDLAEAHALSLRHTVVMETGGMKGRRRELTREELHERLQSAFGVTDIHSEYGMTELFSQAYSQRAGIFYCPPWMRILLRGEDDPLQVIARANTPATGLVNVIDLANLHTCSFIATDDIARLYPDGAFEILGRMDSSDIRGCSLLYA